MSPVYSDAQEDSPKFPWSAFARASGLHIGAAAAAASLREELVPGRMTAGAFDEAFAVARLTPGTNLLAFFALLGRSLGGWRGSINALMLGTTIPSALTIALAAAYARVRTDPITAAAMRGARAGAVAVLLWAAIRLLRSQIEQRPRAVSAITSGAVVIVAASTLSPLIVLLLGGVAGGLWLKSAK